MKTTRILLIASLTFVLGAVACQGNKPAAKPAEVPKPTPPGALGTDVQKPDEPNPTGTPVGERVGDQPVDVVGATMNAPDGTVMTTDQDQATAFLNLIEKHADAPRWVLTWDNGAGQLDLDSVTSILIVTLPGGQTSKHDGITHDIVKAVADGSRGWTAP